MSQADLILVVVDPTRAEQPAVERARWLASLTGWPVRLFVCVYEARLSGSVLFGSDKTEVLRRAAVAREEQILENLALTLRNDGIDVSIACVWDNPLHEAIGREIIRSQPRLVMKDTHYHSAIERVLFTNTDWHLIRECPAPLWLVRANHHYTQPRLMVAVDPTHENDDDLDGRLIEQARWLSGLTGGDMQLLHACDTSPAIASVGALAVSATPLPVHEIAGEIESTHRDALTTLCERHGIAPEQVHMIDDTAAEALPRIVAEKDTDVVVMGTISRSRLRQATIGSTAERVLDRVSCDMLLVKPTDFESPVTL